MSAAFTIATDDVQTATGSTMTSSSSSSGAGYYFGYAVVVIGVVGTAANALILYAMVASKEHKKQLLIFNQNVFDFCSSLLLVIIYAVKLCNIYLTGKPGFWLCIMILSDNLLWGSINGSTINLLSITIERYIKVVHSSWSKKLLRKWVKCSAAAFAWTAGIVYNMVLVFPTSAVIDGVCYGFLVWKNETAALIHGVWNFISFFVVVIFIFVFCYGKILVVIRRQARVMAGHGGPAGSSTSQTPSSQVQSNVIKTMILVSAFYVISWSTSYIFYLLGHIRSDLTIHDTTYHVSMFLAFFYISANPFIYAIKFHPVRRVLVRLIPWKTSEYACESVGMSALSTATTIYQRK